VRRHFYLSIPITVFVRWRLPRGWRLLLRRERPHRVLHVRLRMHASVLPGEHDHDDHDTESLRGAVR